MVTLERNTLVFSFPELHPAAVCRVSFQRTLRIPDDNRSYPLPPVLGTFPLEPVEPHAARLPAAWASASEHGGLQLIAYPMFQSTPLSGRIWKRPPPLN